MAQAKYVTVMLIPEGTENRRSWRVRQSVLKLAGVVIGMVVAGILLFLVFYGKILSRAAMTEKMEAENAELRRYRYKVQLLEENFNQMRQLVSRLATVAGIDFQFPELPDDSTLFAQVDRGVGAVMARPGHLDWSLPVGLPVQGFITQEFEILDDNHYHPGVDIACAVGTPVLATGSGRVLFADFDETYGYMAVIKHSDTISTIYGHNETLLVTEGQGVVVGSRIALSGNTGKSSAPHVHYEIRIHDQPINPMDNPYD